MKIPSRYIHFRWTSIQRSQTSPIRLSFFSHTLTSSINAATKRLALMDCSASVLSSSVVMISSVVLRIWQRSSVPLMYLWRSNFRFAQVSAIFLMPDSIASSLLAALTISLICSVNCERLSAKSLASVKVPGLMSKVLPVTSISLSQWRSRRASFLRSCSSGMVDLKASRTSFTLPNMPKSLTSSRSLGSFFICMMKPSMPSVRPWTSSSVKKSIPDHSVSLVLNSEYTEYTISRLRMSFSISSKSTWVVSSRSNSICACASVSLSFKFSTSVICACFSRSKPTSSPTSPLWMSGASGPVARNLTRSSFISRRKSETWRCVTSVNFFLTDLREWSRRRHSCDSAAQRPRMPATDSSSTSSTGILYMVRVRYFSSTSVNLIS
mmetsp:Transcript_29018/g.67263  ORF Transcript_29018/g.67263 Transcript_29018/m.67263 type:complete len:381 (+) Transcript_29018:9281-10423(+)